ncbi:cell division protein SepF [Corynebacterium sp.]|uniref:cell division protein SepF n=1 Tax=Corynebacterium sp. TaxID=1720 RepID=UPI0026DAEDEE|nr:cell division protein SepF [Corynebacterium sp.]MDO5031396.1 cell division protein SepF [Corynebacterium sp.]
MSLIDRTKEFFGLGPMDIDADDPYYADDRGYTAPSYGNAYEQPAEEANFAPTIVALSVVSFNDAAKVGAPFRDGDAVVFELTDAERPAAKRFVDFAAGLCFALEGRMMNLTKGMDTNRKVFAIVPKGADISTLELERAAHLR